MTTFADHPDVHDEMDFVAPDSLIAKAEGLWTYLPANSAAFMLQVMHPTAPSAPR